MTWLSVSFWSEASFYPIFECYGSVFGFFIVLRPNKLMRLSHIYQRKQHLRSLKSKSTNWVIKRVFLEWSFLVSYVSMLWVIFFIFISFKTYKLVSLSLIWHHFQVPQHLRSVGLKSTNDVIKRVFLEWSFLLSYIWMLWVSFWFFHCFKTK